MPTTIAAGGTVQKDPADKAVFRMTWDEHLAAGVAITASVWAIACDLEAVPALTKDNESSPTTRTTQLRLLGGTLGKRYAVTNRITTDESPAQEKERSFYVVVADL